MFILYFVAPIVAIFFFVFWLCHITQSSKWGFAYHYYEYIEEKMNLLWKTTLFYILKEKWYFNENIAWY